MSRLRADRRVGLLLAGVVFLTFVAIGATVALPASDPDVRGATPASRQTALAARGMNVYRSEGCWYCHTQQVRSTPIDAPYGDPTSARAYAGMSPPMMGTERIGPDLSHVGSRYTGVDDLEEVLTRQRSQMPSYGYLSKDDLRALAAYLFGLK
jgi:cbb3-type cytochrome oxidase cytochrome c subunit